MHYIPLVQQMVQGQSLVDVILKLRAVLCNYVTDHEGVTFSRQLLGLHVP